jgi:hypothetical protein
MMELRSYLAWELYSDILMSKAVNPGPHLLSGDFFITFSHLEPLSHALDFWKAGMYRPLQKVLLLQTLRVQKIVKINFLPLVPVHTNAPR